LQGDGTRAYFNIPSNPNAKDQEKVSKPWHLNEAASSMNQGIWRKWHRWLGFVAAPFLMYAAITGLCLALNEFFGVEEALRERLREVVSPVTLPVADADCAAALGRAFTTVAAQAPGAPVDKVAIEFKGEPPVVTVFIAKPGGGEDRKFVVDARTGELLRTEAYVDKPLLLRLHSGEAWGDGGQVGAMLWSIALISAVVSGVVIYFKMRRPGLKGLRRIFW
jgi:uncharacterized iron-regulated membrane protein